MFDFETLVNIKFHERLQCVHTESRIVDKEKHHVHEDLTYVLRVRE